MRAAPKLAEAERATPLPDAVIRHARKDRLEVSFESNVWAYRFRCMNCHTEGTPQNDKLRQKHGDRVAWFKKAGPAATMEYLLASKLIDSADPEKSLLLRKPMGDDHGGGVKFAVGDDAYKGFRRWIEDVATIRSGKYKAANDLPTAETGPKRFGSDLWLKLENCPPAWGDKLLEARVFVWNAKANAFETEPVAVSDRVVFGKGKTLAAQPDLARRPWVGAGEDLGRGQAVAAGGEISRAGLRRSRRQTRRGLAGGVGRKRVRRRVPVTNGVARGLRGHDHHRCLEAAEIADRSTDFADDADYPPG